MGRGAVAVAARPGDGPPARPDGVGQALLQVDGAPGPDAVTTALDRAADRAGLRTTRARTVGDDPDGRDRTDRWRLVERAAARERAAVAGDGAGRLAVAGLGDGRHVAIVTAATTELTRQAVRRLARALAGGPADRPDEAGPDDLVADPSAAADGAGGTDADGRTAGALTLPLGSAGRRPGASGDWCAAPLPAASVAAATRLGEELGTTTETVLLAVWLLTLSRVSGQTTPPVTVTAGGRAGAEVLDVEVGVDGGADGRALVTGTARALRDARPGRPRDAHLAVRHAERITGGSLSVVVRRCATGPAPADLALDTTLDGDGEADLVLHHDGGRFVPGYPPYLLSQFHTLLDALTGAPDRPVDSHPMSDDAQRRRVVDEFNATAVPLPRRYLPDMLADRIARVPDAAAVITDDGPSLTFRELDRRSAELARELRRRGAGPESVVAVCLGHSASLVVSLLAVLRSGAAYAPIEPTLPPHRIGMLLEQLDHPLLVADAACARHVGRHRGGTVSPDERPDTLVTGADDPVRIQPDGLAYVIFTSGSSGRPKAVMVGHGALANYLLRAGERYGDTRGSGTVVNSSVAFDLTVTSLLAPLVRGHPVRLRRDWREVTVLTGTLADGPDLNLVKITPSHLELVNREIPPERLPAVTGALVVGGENLSGELVAPWVEHAPDTRVFNEYGPTEATVGCCVHEVGARDTGTASVPIGTPLGNCELYVLDRWLQPVPVGVPGEIYIAGTCLARGYRAAPAATASRFVAHPFADRPGARMYRTGDLACHRPEGGLQYLGRADDQVKIRGVRVELAEIRAAIAAHPAVADAVPRLVDDPDRGPFLGAHLLASGPRRIADVDLRTYLLRRLPDYMVPEAFSWIDELPLTGNGKLDTPALPPIVPGGRSVTGPVTPPADDVETALVELFGTFLGHGPVGADEGFFDLGGHSLLAARLIGAVNERFGTTLRVAALFEDCSPDTGAPPGSCRRLARMVRGDDDPGDRTLVGLARRGTGAPLVGVPPAGGDAGSFRDLAASVDGTRPVHGLQPPQLRHPDDVQDVYELAGTYAGALTELAAGPPIVLVGWSTGGLVAFETARLLSAAGTPPACVVLVESYPRSALLERDDPAVLADFASELGRAHDVELSTSADHLRDGSFDDGADHVLDAARAAGIVSSDDERGLRSRLHLQRAQVRGARDYLPDPWDGPVVLVQADEQDLGLRIEAARTWRAACRAGLLVHALPGDHLSILRRPRVDRLVELLDGVLDGLDGRRDR